MTTPATKTPANDPKLFAGFLAIALILIYGFIGFWINLAVLCQNRSCTPNVSDITSGMTEVFTIVGGLVSALVIAELAVTRTREGEGIGSRFTAGTGIKTGGFIRIVIFTYLGIWALVGLAALILGVIIYPDTFQTLSDLGRTWLGLAVAAGYAYFGIQP